MKNFTKAIALLNLLLSFGCSKVVYTHEQVMNTYKTRSAVTKQFGTPTERRTGDSTEEWLYSYDRKSAGIAHADTLAKNVANFSNYQKFVLFNMDTKGNVLGWQCQGVDFTKRESQPGKTVALVAGGVAVVAVIAIISANSFKNSFKFVPTIMTVRK